MKILSSIVCPLVILALPAGAVVITGWDFEADTTTPSTGSGSAALLGTTSTFASGNAGGRGWNTTSYAAQSTESGDRGVSFFGSTIGFEDITISFDHRASGTASRWAQVEYTIDGGTNWTVFSNNNGGVSPHDSFYSFTFDLSTIDQVENQAGFGFRVVSIFSPVAFDQNASLDDFGANVAYQRANSQSGFTPGSGVGTGDYAGGGTWRFDNVAISGTAIPEPAAALLGSLGLLGLLLRRRQG